MERSCLFSPLLIVLTIYHPVAFFCCKLLINSSGTRSTSTLSSCIVLNTHLRNWQGGKGEVFPALFWKSKKSVLILYKKDFVCINIWVSLNSESFPCGAFLFLCCRWNIYRSVFLPRTPHPLPLNTKFPMYVTTIIIMILLKLRLVE